MATQSLLWTVVPNGLTEDGDGAARLGRAVAAAGSRGRPAGPRVVSRLARLAGDARAGEDRAALRRGERRRRAVADGWARPRRRHGRLARLGGVEGALPRRPAGPRRVAYVDHSSKTVVSYEAAGLADYVAGLYGTLAASADGELPTVTGLLNAPGWDSLVAAVDQHRRPQALQRGHRPARHAQPLRRVPRASLRAPAGQRPRCSRAHSSSTRRRRAQVDVVRRARSDDDRIEASWREHEQAKLPEPEDFAKQLDFHKIVGAMSSYPTVLRRLGLVVDLVVARDGFADSADAPLSVTRRLPRRRAGGPATARRLARHARVAVGGGRSEPSPIRSPAPPTRASPTGCSTSTRSASTLVQMDVDGAGLKLMNFARSLARKARGDERVDSVSRAESRLGAPALRTAGLMLVQHRPRRRRSRAASPRTRIKNARAQAVIDAVAGATAPELYAEELLRGFRDRHLGRDDRRLALAVPSRGGVHARRGRGRGRRRAGGGGGGGHRAPRGHDLAGPDDATPTCSGCTRRSSRGPAGASRRRRPGKAIMPDDTVDTAAQTEAALPPGLRFSSRFRAVRGSLPRLRYGRSYWLRARAVDLAGNSLPAFEKDFGPEDPEAQRAAVPALRAGRRAGRSRSLGAPAARPSAPPRASR